MSRQDTQQLSKKKEAPFKDNSKKSGFSALETLGQVDPGQATYFTYERADGTEAKKLIRYPEVSYTTEFLLNEDIPGVLHSSYSVDNFYFADRIDEFAVVDPGKNALFVDVGLYDFCGIEFLDGALEKSGVAWEDAEVFLTHSHDDHDGNAVYCLDKGARRVYIGKLRPFKEAYVEEYLTITGAKRLCPVDISFYARRILEREDQFAGYEDRVCTVGNGDVIEVGDYHFDVIETPGHTLEHICLLERDKGILFAGDHVLDTAPGLMSYYSDLHLLKSFLGSISYLKSLGLQRVFMCHHEPLIGTEQINDFLEDILKTYERPINKMQSMLEPGKPRTVYELAEKYYSYLDSWVEQPRILLSRRIAIAFTYLEYLYDVGRAHRRTAEDGAFEYWIDE